MWPSFWISAPSFYSLCSSLAETIIAITLLGTIICVHLVFHREYVFENKSKPQLYKIFSALTCLFQEVSCSSQICLKIFDNKSYPRIHRMHSCCILGRNVVGRAASGNEDQAPKCCCQHYNIWNRILHGHRIYRFTAFRIL